jgi:hypothetical protein
MSDCTLSVTVASTDLPFLEHTLPHIVRASRWCTSAATC